MSRRSLLLCQKIARGLLFFVNRERRSFIPDSRIEDLSYSLLKDREASYFLFTNRIFLKDRKVLLLLANGHKSYLNPYEHMQGLSFSLFKTEKLSHPLLEDREGFL